MKLRNLITGYGLAGLLSLGINSCSQTEQYRQEHQNKEIQTQEFQYDGSTPFSTFNSLITLLQNPYAANVDTVLSQKLREELRQNIKERLQEDSTALNPGKLEKSLGYDRETADLVRFIYSKDQKYYPQAFIKALYLGDYKDLSRVRIREIQTWVSIQDTLAVVYTGELDSLNVVQKDGIREALELPAKFDVLRERFGMIKENGLWKITPMGQEGEGVGDCVSSKQKFAYSPSGRVMAFTYNTFDPIKRKQTSGGIYFSNQSGDRLIRLQDTDLPENLKQPDMFLASLETNPVFLSQRKEDGRTFYTVQYQRSIIKDQKLVDINTTVEIPLDF